MSLKFRRRLIVAVVLALPVVILFGGALLGHEVLWGWDWKDLFHPYIHASARRWQHGQLAWWTPELGTGYPLFAEGQELQLYPPMQLLLWLMPPWWASGILVAAHYYLAALGTYVFCRRRNLPPLAAVLGALAFTFSATLTWRSIHPTVVVTVALMPTLLCALDAALTARRVGAWAVVSGVLALQLLGGHHQFTFYSLLLAISYILFASFPAKDVKSDVETPRSRFGPRIAERFSGLLWFGVAGLLAAAMCAVPLAATLEMRSLTLRAALPQEWLVGGFGLPPENLWLFFLPHLWGSVENYAGRSVSWEACGYVTVLPFLVAVTALAVRPRHRDLWFWGAVLVASLALAIVDNNPLYQILPHLPVFNWFRAPARYLVLATFALAMLFAHGFTLLTHVSQAVTAENVTLAQQDEKAHQNARRRGLQVLAGVLVLSMLLLALANLTFCGGQSVLWRVLSGSTEGFYHPVKNVADAMFNSLAGWDGVLLSAHLIFGGGALILLLRGHWNARRTGILLLLLLSVDLWRVAQTMKARVDPVYFAYEPPTAAFIKRQPGLYRIQTGECDTAQMSSALKVAVTGNVTREALAEKGCLGPDQNVMVGLSNVDAGVGLELLRSFNLARLLALPPGGQFLSATDEISRKKIILRGADAQARARLLRLLNVRYFVTTGPFEIAGWRKAFSEGADIWESPDVLPRAFLVGAARASSAGAAMRAVLSPDFDPSREAIVENDEVPSLTLPTDAPEDFRGTANIDSYIDSYNDTRMVIRTQSTRPALLVISDTWYPGWKAWVDGVETPLQHADYALRGIALPAGNHRVVCAYRPSWWRPALSLSALSLALWLLLLVVPPLRARNMAAHDKVKSKEKDDNNAANSNAAAGRQAR